jgi:hypothetical protein
VKKRSSRRPPTIQRIAPWESAKQYLWRRSGHVCRSTVIGDKEWCSESFAPQLFSATLHLIARHKPNMIPHSEEEELFKKGSIVETAVGNFQKFFDPPLPPIGDRQAAFSSICAGVLAINFFI